MPSNVNQVISDIEDVKHDLKRNIPTHVSAAMEKLLGTAIMHIEEDANWRGNLASSVRSHGVDVEPTGDGSYEVTVGTDSDIAPYAPFIEFGTGSRSEQSGPGAVRFPPFGRGDAVPVGYPYDSPTMSEGLVAEIIEWVESKPIVPKEDDMSQKELGSVIAASIAKKGTYAHPFLRPAWFKHKLNIKRAARKAVKKSFR